MTTTILASALLLASAGNAAEIVVECHDFRLVLDPAGCATSLVVRASGEECLAAGARIPFATLRQERPYDNEAHLIHPAKPTTLPANRIARKGDVLEVGFAGEYHVLKLRIAAAEGYIAFIPEGTDYRITHDFGDKRRTELDGIEFLRLPVRDRARYGECANVAWDAASAVAVMGLAPEVRIDGEHPEGAAGWRLMRAGADGATGLFGRGAALVAAASSRFLDRVDAMERDFGLPRGVRNRRDPIMRASYCFAAGISPATLEDHLEWIRKGGFRVCMVSYTAFARSCGHFSWKEKAYPNGMADLRRVCDGLRAAGVVPALHFHYNKTSISDPYVKGGADPRIATVRELCLAEDLSPDADTLVLQGEPSGLRSEDGRRIIRFGNEVMSFKESTTTRPWRLLGLERGLFGTARASHARGEYGRHLDVDDWYVFHRLDQNTDIQDEIAARIAEIVDECGFRLLYFDGAEDVPPPYWRNVPLAQHRVWRRFRTSPRGAEGALKSHFGWHMLSRGNAFDTFYPERTRQALDTYILPAARLAADDFSTVDFGWIGFYLPGEKTRRAANLADNRFAATTCGTSPEQIDMIARAAYENNAPLSFKLMPDKLRAHPNADAIMAVFKKYEDLKFPGGANLLAEPATTPTGKE